MHPWPPVLLSAVLLLELFGDSSASTSSTLLRYSRGRVGQLTRSSGAARQSLIKRKAAFGTGLAPLPVSPGVVGNSAAPPVGSGFRQFSQRATQIQSRVQKPFSFRAIFGDVVTNNSDSEGALEHVIPGAKRLKPLVSALTSIAGTAANEALAGFVGGYVLGAGTLSTKRLYGGLRRSLWPRQIVAPRSTKIVAITLLPYPYITQLGLQSLRFHAHNMAWAMEWAKISAVFGACRMLVKTATANEEDGWNSVAGSVVAGAILAAPTGPCKRVLAPVAKTRGALLYGGSMFLLHPYLWKQAMDAMLLTPPSSASPDEPWYNSIDLL